MSANGPRAAIVVPCFNDGATLEAAIGSIAQAADVEIEVVVVDDGSTDQATLNALARLEHAGTRVIRQARQGPSRAAMAGLAATSAPYVMRFDADDLLEPGAVDDLVYALDAHPAAAAAWGDFKTFGLTTFTVRTVPSLDPWLLTYVNCVPGAGSLLRRSALEDVDGWQLRDGHEDWDLWLALAERGYSGVHVPRVVFRYRRDAGGRLMASLGETARWFSELKSRHVALFANRRVNRSRSPAPRALKVAVSCIDGAPGLSRLSKIRLCELSTRLFWNGGLRLAATMVAQGLRLRFRRNAARHG